MRNKEIHDKAWKLLDNKGLNLSEKMMVRSSFIDWSGYKNEHPFIEKKREEQLELDYYYSTYDLIKNFMFKTKNEVILANAIYINMPKSTHHDEFIQLFKYTCRLIGLSTDWN